MNIPVTDGSINHSPRPILRSSENARRRVRPNSACCLLIVVCTWLFASACSSSSTTGGSAGPSVEFTSVPWAGADNPEKRSPIRGQVRGAQPGDQMVLYARAATAWWVQPFADQPFTTIQPDSKWQNTTHPGREYAALLVRPGFQPPAKANELPKEGVLAFAVAQGEMVPWKRWWFLPLCVILVAFAIFGLIQLWLYQETEKLKVRFEARLSERTRVAQELHDTLLQGVISASMQLHVLAEQIPADSPAKSALNRILDLMSRVVEEGRNAVGGLRSPQMASLDLGKAFSQIQQEYASQEEQSFRIIEEGTPCPLNPIIRDEIYSIGREALTNSFRHSKAGKIEVELEYASSGLRVLVRDSGVGFDPKLLQFGRDGHWGLSGMRERAKRINARLRVWSRPEAGTEVELTVPAHIAFVSKPPGGFSKWISKFLPKGRHMFEES